MTTQPDYSKLDTAALVEAAEAALKGVTPGEWQWTASDHRITGLEADNDGDVDDVIWSSGKSLVIDDDDAAFIAAAPALVRALVARLREEANLPPPCKFKVGDEVTVKFWEIGSPEDWLDGQALKITAQEHDPLEEQWWYMVSDGMVSRKVAECGLEPVTNG